MANIRSEGILAKPLRPGVFRACLHCRAWFSLELITKSVDERQGSITSYRCKKCDAKFDFAAHNSPDAV